MKRIYIILFVVLYLSVLLPLCCFAQGSVNEYNALGTPGAQTNADTVMTDTGALTDSAAAETGSDTKESAPSATATVDPADTSDTTDAEEKTNGKDNMTAVIVLIISLVLIAVVVIAVMLSRKDKRG